MDEGATVYVSKVDAYPAILFYWSGEVDEADVKAAFKNLNELLNASETPLYVIVDIRSNPNFPMRTTINEAYWGPFRNPKLNEWLVVGSSSLAQAIGRTLSSVSRRRNIRWFNVEEEAYAYMDSALKQNTDS